MPQQPEKPQQPQLPTDTRTQTIGSEELPYVNEVEAALARKPRLGARFLSLAVGLFFLILGIWANFAEIDEVTHANGQVISSQRTQIIQNLEGGILGAVLVGEGEIVEKGTPLAQLDNKLAESQYRDAQNRISVEIHAGYVGDTLRCLIDGESDDSRWPLTARTAGGRLVHLVGSPDAVGTYRDVKITDSNTWALFGQLI